MSLSDELTAELINTFLRDCTGRGEREDQDSYVLSVAYDGVNCEQRKADTMYDGWRDPWDNGSRQRSRPRRQALIDCNCDNRL